MILDQSLTLLENTDFHRNTGNALIGDIIDLGADNSFRNKGNNLMRVHFVVTQSFATGSNGTVEIKLFNHTADSLTGGDEIWTTGSQTSLAAGWKTTITLPTTLKRYLGYQTVIGTANATRGEASAYLMLTEDDWEAFTASRPRRF